MSQFKDFKKMKEQGERIAMLTAYDFPSARQVVEAGADVILVGDSLGMVVLGYDSTIPVTVDDMIHHSKAVRRGAMDTFIVTDMPFMSYHASKEEAMNNARKMMQEANVNAVKVEGSGDVLEVIRSLTAAGVPVVGHLGLTPQSVGVLGGYKIQGKDVKAAQKLIEDSLQVEAAGAVAIVLECVPKELAKEITEKLSIPTIGIGAGPNTDGQVLVYHDVVQYGSGHVPKFVKQYTKINDTIINGLREYVSEVKENTFPSEQHSFTMNEETLKALYGGKR